MSKSKFNWRLGDINNMTFIVTKDCQLKCKYCYLVGKNSKERMSLTIAKKAIDLALNDRENFSQDSFIWDFIGGEPFLEIDLIDQLTDYMKEQMFMLNHPWFNSYRLNFSTNGLNYHTEKVQNYIKKNHNHLSIGITIDGTERKHNINRVYNNGKGSYSDVVKNIPLWLEQFPEEGTKVTISSPDIPFIAESVLHLYDLGIKSIHINCVFEDVWHDGDDLLFQNQLMTLADRIIERGLYNSCECSFFTEDLGKPLNKLVDNNNWCGSGKNIAVDAKGNIYPCMRFAQYSLRSKKAITVGDVWNGLNKNRLRPFYVLNRLSQSPNKCIDCEVASGCAWCQGENYDAADTATIYQRSTAICKMHKARVRANNYYWNKLYRKLEQEGTRDEFEKHRRNVTRIIC